MAFIDFYNTVDEALSNIESPITHHYQYRGIQLLPASTNPYTQITENTEGVELEDWEVFAVNLCTGEKTDITTKFAVFDNITDSKGFPQIIWTLSELPDLGFGFVYLEINQLLGQTYYTNAFQITAYKSEFTARYDYKEKLTDKWQSIQLNTWYRQKLNRDEITTYYETSTRQTRSVAIKQSLVEKWFTDIVNNELMIKIRDILNYRYTYIDLVKFNLVEAFDIPELSQRQNFAQQDFLISVNKNDLLIENINEMGLIDEINFLKAVVKPITDGGVIFIWDLPAASIPVGYEEETNIAGKTIIGRLDGDIDFGTLGQTGGAKSVGLVDANMPDHTHKMFVNESQDISENRLNLFPDRNATYRGTGEGSADHDYTISSSTTTPTLGNTGVSGNVTPAEVNILNPHRIVNFIKWVGLP